MNDGVTVERLHNNKMWIITFTTLSREMIDIWVDHVRDYRTQQEGTQRYLVYDVSPIKNMGFTNYLRQRSKQLTEEDRDAVGRVAIVIAVNPMVRYLFQMFVEVISQRTQPNLGIKIFNDRHQGIDWVEEGLPVS